MFVKICVSLHPAKCSQTPAKYLENIQVFSMPWDRCFVGIGTVFNHICLTKKEIDGFSNMEKCWGLERYTVLSRICP